MKKGRTWGFFLTLALCLLVQPALGCGVEEDGWLTEFEQPQALSSPYDDSLANDWFGDLQTDRQLLIQACKSLDPSGLEDTLRPDVYREMYDIVTGLFGPMLAHPEEYSEMERFSHAWDYIVSHCTYDHDVRYGRRSLRQMAGFNTPRYAWMLLDRTGVCDDYATTMHFLYDCLELENEFFVGELDEISHAWNLVKIDGEWYHSCATSAIYLANDDYMKRRNFQWWYQDGAPIATADNIYLGEGEASWVTETDGDFTYWRGTNILTGWNEDPNVTELTIPDRTWSIYRSALENKTGLEKITLPDHLDSIDSDAFKGCTALKEFTFPSGLRTVGSHLLQGTAVEEVTIPPNIRRTGYTLAGSNIKKATYAPGCLQTFEGMFKDCTQLTEVEIPDSLLQLDTYFIQGCTALTELDLSHLECSVDVSAFFESSLESLKMPRVEVLPTGVFNSCRQLKHLELQEGLQVIQGWSFVYNDSLGEVRIPASVMAVETFAFISDMYGGLCSPDLSFVCAEGSAAHRYAQTHQIPFTIDPDMAAVEPVILELEDTGGLYIQMNSVTRSARLYGYNEETLRLEEDGTLVLPDLVHFSQTTEYYPGMFITYDYYFPLSEIGDKALYNAPMTGLRLPQGLVDLGEEALSLCHQLEELDLSQCIFLTEVPRSLCEGCAGLKKVVLGGQITTVGEQAFFQCMNLSQLQTGESLTRIEKRAFQENNLGEIWLGANLTYIGFGAFSNQNVWNPVAYFQGDAPYVETKDEEDVWNDASIPFAMMALHRPDAAGFDREWFDQDEVGIYEDGCRVAMMTEEPYLVRTNEAGVWDVYVHMMQLGKNPEYMAVLTCHDARNRMLSCGVGYLFASNPYVPQGVRFRMEVPEGTTRMTAYLMESGTLVPVSIPIHHESWSLPKS